MWILKYIVYVIVKEESKLNIKKIVLRGIKVIT